MVQGVRLNRNGAALVTDNDESAGPEVRASRLLRNRVIWITPAILGGILIFLMTLTYLGSVVDPASHLRGLPVLVVNQDQGTTVAAKRIDIGAEVVSALEHSPAVSTRLSLDSTTFAHAEARMNKNDGYLTIVIPPGSRARCWPSTGWANRLGERRRYQRSNC
jgi:YhgE/Pip-like protein